MSESYTIGGDTLYKCDNPLQAGQTFRPLQTHILEYIDLELKGATIIGGPVVLVFDADLNHEPSGDYLSRDRYTTELPLTVLTLGRTRFSMQPVTLYAGKYYVIVVRNYPALFEPSVYWQYNADGSTYPRGHRISTNDGGTTWELHIGSDHIFAEFGTPPLPKPKPPPPIRNFAIPDISFFYCQNTVTITLSTSVPCHLTCYYTDEKPLKHHTTRTVRGLTVPWGTYFCFVAWKAVEQTEDGDTLYHTFPIPDWPPGLKRWFTFRGEVDNIDSPSVGPIFNHTPSVTTPFQNGSFDIWTDPAQPPPPWYHEFSGPGASDYIREETIVHDPPYSARLVSTNLLTFTWLKQTLCSEPYAGKNIEFSLWFRSIGAGQPRFIINQEGPGSWVYSYGSGPTGWKNVKFTRYIDPAATIINIKVGNLGLSPTLNTSIWDQITMTEV